MSALASIYRHSPWAVRHAVLVPPLGAVEARGTANPMGRGRGA